MDTQDLKAELVEQMKETSEPLPERADEITDIVKNVLDRVQGKVRDSIQSTDAMKKNMIDFIEQEAEDSETRDMLKQRIYDYINELHTLERRMLGDVKPNIENIVEDMELVEEFRDEILNEFEDALGDVE